MLALLGCRASDPSLGPSAPERETTGVTLELLQPGCVAWAPSTGRFACVQLRATPTEGNEQDLGGESMADTLARAQQRNAALELAVVEVEPGFDDVWIAAIDPNLGPDLGPESARQQHDGIALLLAARGFSRPLVGTISLEAPDALMADPVVVEARSELTGLLFRYECNLHEGDASFEYYATLSVVCGPGQAPKLILEQLGGPLARLSFSEDGRFGVITIEHQDGGEGYVDVTWKHHAFALEGLCS